MACRLFGVKTLPEPKADSLLIRFLETNFCGIIIEILKFCIKENAFYNLVCQMAAAFDRTIVYEIGLHKLLPMILHMIIIN